MQEQMTQAQEQLDEQEYEASAGGGVVTCRVNGKREVLELTIKPEAVDPDDVEMLQDMVMAAVNAALRMGEENRKRPWQRWRPADGRPVLR